MVGAGEEGGQSAQVGVVGGEEGLALLPRRQQAGVRGETGQSVGAQQGRRRPVGMFRGVLHADGAPLDLQRWRRRRRRVGLLSSTSN